MHLVRDLIEYEVNLVPREKSPEPVTSYREILNNNPLHTVISVSDRSREPQKGLYAAMRANTWARSLHVSSSLFIGKVDDITQNNFSLTEIKMKFAELNEAMVTERIQARNADLKEWTNVFELCERNDYLTKQAYQSVLSRSPNPDILKKVS